MKDRRWMALAFMAGVADGALELIGKELIARKEKVKR